MNMYKFILSFTFMTILYGMRMPPKVDAQTLSKDSEPEVIVTSFYKWYLHILNKNGDPFKEGKKTLKSYVTARRIAAIEKEMKSPDGLDHDYFLQAQDWADEWENDITATKTAAGKTTASVRVILGAKSKSKHQLMIRLSRENDKWKISEVK